MMESVKTALVNYAVCAFAGGILEYLVPDKGKKAMRITTLAVIIAVTLIPLLSIDTSEINEKIYSADYSAAEETADYAAEAHKANLLKKEIYEDVRQRLINLGIDEYEIYISTDYDEQNKSLVLSGIKVDVGKEYESAVNDVEKEFNSDYGEILTVGVKENE